MRILTFLLMCTALGLAPGATAQPEDTAPPTVAITFWQCERGALDQLIEYEQTRGLPILQAFVDRGRIFEAGTMVHAWGDEWNYVQFIVAPDIATATAANGEIGDAYEAAYPDDTLLLDRCSGHHDNIYTVRTGQGFVGAVTPDDPATVALSFWKCPISQLGRLMDQEVASSAIVAQELLDEGLWRGSGFMTHAWGDAWNVVRYSAADDIPALLTAFDTADERMQSRYASMEPTNLGNTCSAHRDNIYDLVVRTTPRAE
jgi:hypothetical protein